MLYKKKRRFGNINPIHNIRAEMFSTAAFIYEYLTGKHPYQKSFQTLTSPSELHRMHYQPSIVDREEIPLWFDATLKKACALFEEQRYEKIDSFIDDLTHPNPQFLSADFIERYSSRLPVFPLGPLLSVLWVTSIIIMGLILLN